MSFEVQILGSNSALSSHGRHPSSQIVRIRSHTFLIDCGEGTQFQFQKYKCKPFRINCVFISHLHGDHYFGLIGLLTTYQLLKRETPLTIYGPPELETIVNLQLSVAGSTLTYPITFVSTQARAPEIIIDDEDVTVQTIPLVHRIPCTGFIIREKQSPRKIDPDRISGLHLSPAHFDALRRGEDVTDNDGVFHRNARLTIPGYAPRSYAYCTDTLYLPEIVPYIEEVDLLYHEATFLDEARERAVITFHSTAAQAATLAKSASVNRLVIGHFSSKYPDLQEMLDEARRIFLNTELAIEGKIFSIERSDRL